MCSGDPETSCGNSQNTGFTTADTLEELFGPEFGKMCIHGDDNTSIVKEKFVRRSNLSIDEASRLIVAGYARYGFIAKVKIHTSLAKAEFCSGVFWPAVVKGTETYVLGAKPGKQLPKIGYGLQKHAPGVVKAMMFGNLSAYHFVPLLSTYCTSMLSKMSKIEMTAYHDKEAQYKILNAGVAIETSSMLGEFFEERYDLDLVAVEKSLSDVLLNADLDSSIHWELLNPLREVDA